VEVFLAVVGIVLVTIGSSLLYMFKDPHFGSSIMLESFEPRKQAIGARAGLVLNLAGAATQLAAVLIAVD
jgi:hypothetical protein